MTNQPYLAVKVSALSRKPPFRRRVALYKLNRNCYYRIATMGNTLEMMPARMGELFDMAQKISDRIHDVHSVEVVTNFLRGDLLEALAYLAHLGLVDIAPMPRFWQFWRRRRSGTLYIPRAEWRMWEAERAKKVRFWYVKMRGEVHPIHRCVVASTGETGAPVYLVAGARNFVRFNNVDEILSHSAHATVEVFGRECDVFPFTDPHEAARVAEQYARDVERFEPALDSIIEFLE